MTSCTLVQFQYTAIRIKIAEINILFSSIAKQPVGIEKIN